MNIVLKAQHVAIRLFFANITDNVQDAYNHLYDCDEPYTTYIDDHCQGKSWQPWQPFEMRTVADMQELVENLVDDIVTSMKDDPEPDEQSEPECPECPECHSTALTKKGREGDKQRFKCKDCGKHFYH